MFDESLKVRVSESECLKARVTSKVWILGFKWLENLFLKLDFRREFYKKVD